MAEQDRAVSNGTASWPLIQRMVMQLLIGVGAVAHALAYVNIVVLVARTTLSNLGDRLPENVELAVDFFDGMDMDTLTSGMAGEEFSVSGAARRLDDGNDGALRWLIFIVLYGVIVLALCCGGGFCYHARITSKRTPFTGAGTAPGGTGSMEEFTNPRFGCCEDMDYCILGWCCFQCRTGDTWHASGMVNYWAGFCLIVGLDFLSYTGSTLSSLTRLGSLIWLVAEIAIVVLLTSFRARLRGVLGKSGACNCCDCLMAFFCAPCANCQEAKEIDQAMNVRTQPCCCDIFPVAPPPALVATVTVVGQPVVAPAPPPVQAEVVVVQAQVIGVQGNYVHPEK